MWTDRITFAKTQSLTPSHFNTDSLLDKASNPSGRCNFFSQYPCRLPHTNISQTALASCTSFTDQLHYDINVHYDIMNHDITGDF